MHSLLEQYLGEVSKHLSPLPLARRNEELWEMREHLLNALTTNRKMGQSEDEAAANAVTQFGTPEESGKNVVWAWQREAATGRRSFWSAAACGVVLTLLGGWAVSLLCQSLLAYVLDTPRLGAYLSQVRVLCLSLMITNLLVVGWVCGCVFPKRAASGTGSGMMFLSLTVLVVMLHLYRLELFHLYHTQGLLGVALGILILPALGTVGTLSAWAGSRWREGRAQLADKQPTVG